MIGDFHEVGIEAGLSSAQVSLAIEVPPYAFTFHAPDLWWRACDMHSHAQRANAAPGSHASVCSNVQILNFTCISHSIFAHLASDITLFQHIDHAANLVIGETFAVMAPQELVGRYKRYKHGTNNLIYWLTQTAASCSKDVVQSLRTSGSRKTMKGGNKKKRHASAEQPRELELCVEELVGLAEAISCAEPLVRVPRGIILLIADVIAERKACSEWYSTQNLRSGSRIAKEDEGHWYFIEVSAFRMSNAVSTDLTT